MSDREWEVARAMGLSRHVAAGSQRYIDLVKRRTAESLPTGLDKPRGSLAQTISRGKDP